MNNLVYVGKVLQLIPIEGADRIESAIVVCGEGGKWQGCVLKESFKVGDKMSCVPPGLHSSGDTGIRTHEETQVPCEDVQVSEDTIGGVDLWVSAQCADKTYL